MQDTPLPYSKIPIREGRNTITSPSRMRVIGVFALGGERYSTLQIGDAFKRGIPAHQYFVAFPLEPPLDFDASVVVHVIGPGKGNLILRNDADVTVTWEPLAPVVLVVEQEI